MSNTFSTYFNQQALIDQLPFKIDFEIAPVAGLETKTVAGIEFQVINDLVSRESWFFKAIESLNSTTVKQAGLQLRSLNARLQEALGLESIQEAGDILWNGSEELQADPRYIKFHSENYDDIQELMETMILAQDNQALNWMRVTFFILSRATSDWSLSQTVGLTDSQIEEIVDFITLEMNGGIPLEDEPESDNVIEGEEGK